jgi:hypothetical protein
MVSPIEVLETEYVYAYFDSNDLILKVTYHKLLTPEITNSVYRWIGRILQSSPGLLGRSRGSIYDFTQVRQIDAQNIVSAQQNSTTLNMKVDMSRHPVALIAQTQQQRDYLTLSMKITPGEKRKRLVSTLYEALQFIDEFHAELAAQKSATDIDINEQA